MIEQIAAGDVRALARAATMVENHAPGADLLLKELFPRTGHALVIGVTGAPGSGKSTLLDQLIRHDRARGKTVGVLAVDPTSPYTGGAILGDRIRMQSHHADPGVFIRSMATRGWLGGLARATTDLALLLDAAGRDVVFIETVGVGQDEVEVARLAEVTVVVLVPGMGDEVQVLKAGILEIADVMVINKADHPGAGKLEQDLRQGGAESPIVRTVATEGMGIEELADVIEHVRTASRESDRSVRNWALRLREMLRERLLDRFPQAEIEAAARQVALRERDPYSIVEQWLVR